MRRENTRLQRAKEQRLDRAGHKKSEVDTLDRIEAIAKIVSLIIIPIVIALTGWWVQSSVADAGIKKDYVAMAMGILKDKSADRELVVWASEVVRENSPTPLSNELQGKIIRSTLQASYAASILNLAPPPDSLMKAPPPVPEFPLEKLKAGTLTEKQAIELWINDHSAAKRNELTLRALQEWVRITRNAEKDYRQSVLNNQEKSLLESTSRKK